MSTESSRSANRTPDEPQVIETGLTPWQRMRVFRNVAKRLRAEGRTYDADRLDEFARHNAERTVIEGERRD